MRNSVDITETPEYRAGERWVDKNRSQIAELYSSTDMATSELRTKLFGVAEGLYPPKRESMENDVRQTLFVSGAFHRISQIIPLSQEALWSAMDVAMEMGSMLGAELAKQDSLELLKKKPKGWWRRKFGDATPLDVANALSNRWWREVGNPKGLKRTSKWEILIYTTGSREMSALETLRSIELNESGEYHYYSVEGEDSSFDVMARPVIHQGVVVQYAGDIVG